jgi:nucleoside-diphosphate-sugar epimerase
MRILVTGGSGNIGQFTVAELVNHGHEVIIGDKRAVPNPHPLVDADAYRAATFKQIETTDVSHVAWALQGCDAVIHLGAIPAPRRNPDTVVFGNNVMGTFTVLHSCELLGINKAVIASSLSALGTAWSEEPTYPLYAPVDEAHPLLTRDCYALSKEVDERTAEMFHRRTGMQVVAMRYCYVGPMDDIQRQAAATQGHEEDGLRVLWAYVDCRDVARANRLAVEADGLGFVPIQITASDTLSNRPTAELLRQYTPNLEIRRPIPGTQTAFDLSRAKELLGWEPIYSWRDA